jgi:hypothetical protein
LAVRIVFARVIGIDRMTLRKHSREELRTAGEQIVVSMGAAVVPADLAGNMHAAKYWLSTHDWREWRVAETRVIAGAPRRRRVWRWMHRP